MERYYFITCEDLLYVIKRNGIYDLPKAPFELPFYLKHKEHLILEIKTKTKNYELALNTAEIEFPGVTENWKRRRELILSGNISNIIVESTDLYHPTVRSAVFPILNDNRIILVKPVYMDYYEIPGGQLDYMGHPEATAKKEVLEECNLNVRIDRYFRTRSYILERVSPTLRINPRWYISIEFIGRVIGGEPQAKNEIEKVVTPYISEVAEGKAGIKIRNDLMEGIKAIQHFIEKE
ncbi:MAG: NUDIX hydrolase [Spirochaetota bacterium]